MRLVSTATIVQCVRREEFTNEAPGRLTPIQDGIAFVPNDLPPEIPPSWELVNANQEAALAVGKLAGQARLVSNEELITGALVFREAVESNRIEGTQTLIEEVLLQRSAGPPRDRATADANLEVLRYVESLHAGADAISAGQPLSLFLVRALHRNLIEGTRGDSKSPGSFRTRWVAIGRPGEGPEDARFVPPPPELVPDAIDAWAQYLASEPGFGPLIACGLLHYQFETIHPFEDGNGRLGRLLIPLYFVAKGVMDRPLLYLSEYLEKYRDEYVHHLKRVSTDGDWQSWLLFFLKGVRDQAIDARKRVARVLDLQADYRERIRRTARSQVAYTALDYAMDRVYVTAPEVEHFTGRNYRTARSALDALTELGILRPIPESYPQRWVAEELLREVYKQ